MLVTAEAFYLLTKPAYRYLLWFSDWTATNLFC